MSEKVKPNIITDADFEKNSIKNMATRPTRPSAFGVSALSPEQVKERFDRNPEMLKNKINELIEYLPYLAPDVNVEVAGTVLTLAALGASIAATNGVRMQDLLKVDYGAEFKTLAEAFAALIEWLSDSDEKREDLSEDLDDAVDRIDNAEREIKATGERIDELSDITLNLNYILSNDGTYYICDGGKVVGDIVIPSSYKKLPVKEINDAAFYGDRWGISKAITSVIIPASVQRIGSQAFAQQWSLGKIVLKGTPEIIGYSAFDTTATAAERGEEAVECNLYVPFSEGEIDGAPWGLSGTIHYETKAIEDRVAALEELIGDIDSAFDDLHNYAQNLIDGGDS